MTERDNQEPPASRAEDTATEIDAWCREHGWDWVAELTGAAQCYWQCKLTVVLTPNRAEGRPDRSLVTLAAAGQGPDEVFRRAWQDMRAWIARHDLDGDGYCRACGTHFLDATGPCGPGRKARP
jgi:hypothetical protein